MLEIRHDRMDDTFATQEAYNQIYSHEGILLRDSMYLWLVSLLEPQPGKSLLDISTGQGRLVALARHLGLNALGTDFSEAGLKVALDEVPEGVWAVGDGEQLPYASQSLDYVSHIGSLEHYQNPARGAFEIARVLKPGGRAVILVPNSFGLWGNIKHVLLHGEIFDDGQPLQRYGTRETWRKLLEGNGLRVCRVVGYGEVEIPRTRKDLAWYLLRPHKVLRLLLSYLIPVNLANHLAYICEPQA